MRALRCAPLAISIVLLVACGSSSSDDAAPAATAGGAGGGSAGAGGSVAGAGGNGGSPAGAGGAGGATAGAGGATAGAGGASTCACVAGSSKACSELGKLYAADGKQATCKADCSAWDVAACTTEATGTKQEYVYPGLRDPRFAGAKCNDGSPFWFRVSLTGSRRWVVSFEGGGACDGATIPCQPRYAAAPPLFSSKNDPKDGTVAPWKEPGSGGIVSRSKTLNPTFADANMVSGNYCSSDLWTGTATTAVKGDIPFDLLFAGRLNARAMVQTLIERYGLDDAKDLDIIVTGQSAGGNGARNNADLFADAFPKAKAASRLWLLPSAGFQLYDWSRPGAGVMGSDLPDPESWKLIFPRWSAEANAKCTAMVAAEGLDVSACLTGLYSTRSMVRAEPQGYGLRVLDATNRADPVYLKYHMVGPALPTFDAIVDQWEPIATKEMLDSELRWMFSPAHRGEPNLHGVFDVWASPLVPAYDASKDPCKSPWPASIKTFRDLVDAWYADKSPATSGIKVCLPDGWPE